MSMGMCGPPPNGTAKNATSTIFSQWRASIHETPANWWALLLRPTMARLNTEAVLHFPRYARAVLEYRSCIWYLCWALLRQQLSTGFSPDAMFVSLCIDSGR